MLLIKKTCLTRCLKTDNKGIANISVLLVVVIIMLIISALIPISRYNIKNTERFLNYMRANHYAQGAQAHVINKLRKEYHSADINYNRYFNRFEAASVEFDDIRIDYQVDDLQSKYNLNNVERRSSDKENFLKIIRIIDKENLIYNQIIDWLDKDEQVSEKGAEDSFYSLLDSPFLAANQRFISMEELLLLPSVNRENLSILKRYFTVLPTYTHININTSSPEIADIFIEDKEAKRAIKNKILNSESLNKILGKNSIFTAESDFLLFKCKVSFKGYNFYYNSFLRVVSDDEDNIDFITLKRNFLRKI